jgi:uncharacterized membrane protein
MSGGHSHSHAHDHELGLASNLATPAARLLTSCAGVLALLTLIGVALLWADGDVRSSAGEVGFDSERYGAEVTSATLGDCSYATEPDPDQCVTVVVEPSGGPDEGTAIALGEYGLADPFLPDLDPGDRIVVGYEDATDTYFYADQERRLPLLLLFGLFVAAVVALARMRGVRALVALAVTVVVLLEFVVPAVLDGNNPMLVSLVGAAAIAYLALYFAHGINPMTTAALLGALGALALTAGLAWLFFEMASFTGAVSDEATYLPLVTGEVDVRGLLLGGVIIGALGALDDMTVTQASAVFELRAVDPDMPARRLYRSAMRIGREHVGSTVNTLLLAYVGAGMPLLLLFVLSDQSLGTVANSEVVAVEIVRTLVGSIGLVAAVPITTALAAWVVSGTRTARHAPPRASTPSDPPRTAPG